MTKSQIKMPKFKSINELKLYEQRKQENKLKSKPIKIDTRKIKQENMSIFDYQ